jgi:tRNA (guanosine-2'-O-)-methyltransferase
VHEDKIEQLTSYLSGFVSEPRRRRMEQVLAERTRWITLGLEDIYQPHNTSAVLRSCECFGVQDVHIIENRNEYNPSPQVDMGSSGWLTLNRYEEERDNTELALDVLRERGYKLVATTPHRDDCLLEDLAVHQPIALLFGTEETGLSERALAAADTFVRIPMYGFTESFNISVCAALMLHELTRKIRAEKVPWALGEKEKAELRLQWYRDSIRGAELIEQRYWAECGVAEDGA